MEFNYACPSELDAVATFSALAKQNGYIIGRIIKPSEYFDKYVIEAQFNCSEDIKDPLEGIFPRPESECVLE